MEAVRIDVHFDESHEFTHFSASSGGRVVEEFRGETVYEAWKLCTAWQEARAQEGVAVEVSADAKASGTEGPFEWGWA